MKEKALAKKFLCGFAAVLMAVTAPAQAFASTSNESSISPSSVSINVQNADVRDVLSAVAKNMGYSIVYSGEVSTISIKLEDMAPSSAFDYLLKSIGMTYIKEGNVLIVGSRDVLTQEYARSLALSRFNLQYITSSVLTEKIEQLQLPVTVITMDSNQKSIWVQGFAADIAKVRQLINVLDLPENYVAPESTTSGSSDSSASSNKKSLSFITLSNFTSYDFNRFLQTLGINYGLSLADEGNRLYLYATEEERQTVQEIVDKIDYGSKTLKLNNSNMFEVLSVKNISKSTAVSSIQSVCPNLTVISVENAAKSFLVRGTSQDIDLAKELLAELDGVNNSALKDTFFSYTLTNITAAEAARRLEQLSFGDNVTWYVSDYSEFAKTIYIYCNSDYRDQVSEALGKMDSSAVTTYNIPVYKASSQAAAESMMSFLNSMLAGYHGNLSVQQFGDSYVVYLQNADAETAALVDSMIERLSGLASDDEGSDKQDVSYSTWVNEYIKKNGQDAFDKLSDEQKLQAYVQWVEEKTGSQGKSSGTSFMSSASNVPTPTAAPTATPAPSATPAPTASPAPVAGKESVDSAFDVLNTYFNGLGANSYIYNHRTTVEVLMTVAQKQLNDASLSDVTLSFAKNSAGEEQVSYTAPTAEKQGKISVRFQMEMSGYSRELLVEHSLPVAPETTPEATATPAPEATKEPVNTQVPAASGENE